MFLKERQDAIAEQVKADGRVTVTDLATRYDVTEDCIRKDLKTLSDQGLLKRVYGGAISIASKPERNVRKRVTTNAAEKRAIAEKAVGEIEDGETIFLDVSTTNLVIAQALAATTRRVAVVSNMIDILQVLAENDSITTIGTGGTMNFEQNGFFGAYTLDFLKPIHFDRAFIGALGIDLENGGVWTFDLLDGLVKRCAIENSGLTYLVADAHKFGAPGTYQYAELTDFDIVVTDKPSPVVKRMLKKAGIACL